MQKKQGIELFVIGAVIPMSSKILLVRREPDDFRGGEYEIPSGKVELGESLEDAVRREVKEETNLDVTEITRFLGAFDYKSQHGRNARRLNFVVTIDSYSEIKLTDHDEYVWVERDQLDRYGLGDEIKKILESFWINK